MKLIQRLILAIFVISILLLPSLTLADGGVFPKPDNFVTETDQKAVIIEGDNQETMILSTTFKGDPKEFAWIIPTPSKPEVTKSSDDVFNGLADLTQVKSEVDSLRPMSSFTLGTENEAPVKIIKTEKIDIYDVTTLSATDADALSKWLADNGFQFPENASTILEDYVDNSWFFVAVKIDPTHLTKVAEEQLVTGHGTPLKFNFETSKLVFPLKISSVMSEFKQSVAETSTSSGEENQSVTSSQPKVDELVSIQLFILSDHKKEAPSFTTLYANQVTAEEIKNAATDTSGNPWYEPKTDKVYLTSLARSMKPSEMTSDVFIINSPDNRPVGAGENSGLGAKILIGLITFLVVLVAITLSPFGLLFVVAVLAQTLSKSKMVKIIGWVFQAIFLLSLIALVGIFVLVLIDAHAFSADNLDGVNFVYILSSLVAVLFVIIGEILAIIYQIKHMKQEEEKNSKIGDKIFDVDRRRI